ncbi:MAG: D-alanyl-D-alanine carboxypeptidase [Desulfobacterales bacterium]
MIPQHTIRLFFRFRLFLPLLMCLPVFVSASYADRSPLTGQADASRLYSQIGDRDAVILMDPSGRLVAAKHINRPIIPASTLKVLTALASLHYLGESHRFSTLLYQDDEHNLYIKGFGDPLLVSETINAITAELAEKLASVNDIILDAGYFADPISIPGISDSLQPYDAPNGALCANFNTVNFKRLENGVYTSAEPQTPLIPFVMKRVRSSECDQGRIMLSAKAHECILYTGHLFAFFLEKHGVRTGSRIRMGDCDPHKVRHVYTHVSEHDLMSVIEKMLHYSNNYIANQLLIAASAKAYGEPGSLDKGVAAIEAFCRETFGSNDISLSEGSGISRKNRVTASYMAGVLKTFQPYHHLLRKEKNIFFKTGTLRGIRTRIGYIAGRTGGLYPFGIFFNTPGKTDEAVLKQLREVVDRIDGPNRVADNQGGD